MGLFLPSPIFSPQKSPSFSCYTQTWQDFFFELSLCCKAICAVIPEVCNPPSIGGAATGCFCVLSSSVSIISRLQARSNCFYVHVISQQTKPSLQPKELFLSQTEYFHCKPLVVSLSLTALCTKIPRAHFPRVDALLMPHLVKPCVFCQQDPVPNRNSCLPQCRKC